MIALERFQYSLVGDIDTDDEVPFGLDQTVEVDEDGFDPGSVTWVTQDGENQTNGTVRMGVDVLGPAVWGLDLYVNCEDEDEALAGLAVMQKAWLYAPSRFDNGKVSALRYNLGGRIRRIFGRPREWSAKMNNRFLSGMIPITANFKTVDALYYDDDEQSVTIGYISESEGGMILPVVLPAISDPPGEGTNSIFVGGDHDAFPVIRFVGPITNPSLSWGDKSLVLNYDILEGDYVEIDTQRWAQTITRSGGYSVPGALARGQYLEDMTLAPNQQHDFSFRGFSSSGTAQCIVRWRNAHTTL